MCEIVQQWVGRAGNTFWYCRDHKVECESQTECATTRPPRNEAIKFSGGIATSPWWAITNLMVGFKLTYTGVVRPLWTAGKDYTILSLDPYTETLVIETDGSSERIYARDLPGLFSNEAAPSNVLSNGQPMVASNQANRHPAHLATTPWHYSHVLGLTITNGAASRQFCVRAPLGLKKQVPLFLPTQSQSR